MEEPKRIKSLDRSNLELYHSRLISKANTNAQLAIAWAILTLTTISIPFYFFDRTEVIRWLLIDIAFIIALFIIGLVISFIVYNILMYSRRPRGDDKELRWNRKLIILISLGFAILVGAGVIIGLQKNIELIKPLLFLYSFGPAISYFLYQIYRSIDISRICYIKANVIAETLGIEKTIKKHKLEDKIKKRIDDETKYSFPRWVERNYKRFIGSILGKKSEKKSK